MRRILAVSTIAALLVPQATAQTTSPATKLAECRMALRDAMQAALKFPVIKREKTEEDGGQEVIAVLNPGSFTVLGQPALGLQVKRVTSVLGQDDAFVTRVALDYPAVRRLLPKAYGKSKCDAEGTAFTYCQMTMPEDASVGRRRVTMGAEPAEGGGTMLSCNYSKLDD